jgi:hypothetical protein
MPAQHVRQQYQGIDGSYSDSLDASNSSRTEVNNNGKVRNRRYVGDSRDVGNSKDINNTKGASNRDVSMTLSSAQSLFYNIVARNPTWIPATA